MIEIFALILMIALLGTSALLWWKIAKARATSSSHLLTSRNDWLTPLGLVDVLVVVAIEIFSQSVAIAIVFVATGSDDIDFDDRIQMTLLNYILGGFQLIAGMVIMAYLRLRYFDSRAAGWRPAMLRRDLKLGVAGFLLFVPPMLVLQAILTQFWPYEHPTMELISPDSSLSTIASAWLMATIVAPFNEEIVFRVVLLGWLLRCFANPGDLTGGLLGGKTASPATPRPPSSENYATESLVAHRLTWPPVLIVALLFALVHIGQGPAPIPIFFLGIGLCVMYCQTGSLVPCVVTHFLLNTFSMAVFTIERLYFPQLEHAASPNAESFGQLCGDTQISAGSIVSLFF